LRFELAMAAIVGRLRRLFVCRCERCLVDCNVRLRQETRLSASNGSDCDDDHISDNKAEDPLNSTDCLGTAS
jgi:hypothetical protein